MWLCQLRGRLLRQELWLRQLLRLLLLSPHDVERIDEALLRATRGHLSQAMLVYGWLARLQRCFAAWARLMRRVLSSDGATV